MIIYILLICHIIADFYFQPSYIAKKKQNHKSFLFIHGLIYTLIFAGAFGLLCEKRNAATPFFLITISHLVIDHIRIKLENRYRSPKFNFICFIIDQGLHVFIILITVKLFCVKLNPNLLKYIEYEKYGKPLILYILIFMIVWSPAAIFIQKLFAYIIPSENEILENSATPEIGRIIGKLERFLITYLILFNQLGSVGFIIAAKSIARFKQFDEQNFAEKYLVGTLASISIAFITTLIIKI